MLAQRKKFIAPRKTDAALPKNQKCIIVESKYDSYSKKKIKIKN